MDSCNCKQADILGVIILYSSSHFRGFLALWRVRNPMLAPGILGGSEGGVCASMVHLRGKHQVVLDQLAD
ncbi:hypothetical protein MRX96_058369 [Rhipicephalus microplus]